MHKKSHTPKNVALKSYRLRLYIPLCMEEDPWINKSYKQKRSPLQKKRFSQPKLRKVELKKDTRRCLFCATWNGSHILVIVKVVVLKDTNTEIFGMSHSCWPQSINYLSFIHKSRVLLLGSYTPPSSFYAAKAMSNSSFAFKVFNF